MEKYNGKYIIENKRWRQADNEMRLKNIVLLLLSSSLLLLHGSVHDALAVKSSQVAFN